MLPDTSQVELWSHFQTERPEDFEDAHKRLSKLLRLAESLSRGRTILNIGCGNGYLEQSAQEKRWAVISVDPDPKSVERIKSMGIDARCGSISALPVETASVDVVVCTEVFEHLSPKVMEAGLEEIQRVLRPGGHLIGTVPYRENLATSEVFCPDCHKTFHRWGHLQSFDEAKMRGALTRHLAVKKIRPVYLIAWNRLDWKGKLLCTARSIFSLFGAYGSSANLLFVATRTAAAQPSS